MKKAGKSLASFLICLALLISVFPAVPALAANYTQAPENLSVPPLAYDESKIVVMWEKPADYYESSVAIKDYEVYMDDVSLGLASENFANNYAYVNAYMEEFYDRLDDNHYQIKILSFTANGLEPETEYTFKVRAVYANNEFSEFSNELTASTAPAPIIIDAADYGAVYVESVVGDYSTRRANNNEALIAQIADNTAAIQAAIDATPAGGKVVLKGNGNNAAPYYYVSGALFLHSNMTIEIEEGAVLFGSPVFDHYPRSLLVYPYSQDIRTYGLLNAVSWDYGSLENIRIVGKGAVDGNGWKTVGNGFQNKGAVDPTPAFTDPTGNDWRLRNYQGGSNSTVDRNQAADASNVLGILAADAMWQGRQDRTPNAGNSQYYNARPNLTVARGVNGLYYEGLTFYNPAFHGIVNYQSEGITANGVITMSYNDNNGDGIEFGDCLDLYIMNSFWDCGDDAINFAAGQGTSVRNLTGRVASGEGRVFNNFVRNSHGGLLAMGSHTGGFIGDMVAEENVANSNETGTNGLLRLKSGATTGGGVRNVVVRDNAINYVTGGNSTIVIDTSYSDGNASTAFGPESEQPLIFENVLVRNLTISNSIRPVMNVAAPGASSIVANPIIRDFTFEDIAVLNYNTSGGNISINGIENLTLRNITGLRTAITTTNCTNVTIENCDLTEDRTPAPLEWTDSLVTSVSGNIVDVSWPAVTNATQYAVLVDMLDGYGYQTKETVTETNTTIALNPNTDYKIAVRPQATGIKGELVETSVTTASAVLTSPDITISNPAVGVSAASGISWQDVRWAAASDATYGIHYYELTAVPESSDYETKTYKAYFDRPARGGYALWGLDDGVEYTVSVSAVNWVGQKASYGSAVFTTVPGTLMQIPQWDSNSELTASSATRVGDEIVLTWDESDVTEYSNGDTAVFAGYRILVNSVPVDGGAVQATAIATVAPGVNTYTVNTEKFLPDVPYTISVEAGNQLLKYASGSGGLSGSTGFTGTQNTDLARNQVTFGKWTGHGPSIEVTLLPSAIDTVTFDYNGGEGSVENKEVLIDEAYGELPEATYEGYVLLGWSTDGTEANIVTADTVVSITGNHTLKAVWDEDYADGKARVKLSGSSAITVNDIAEYIVAVANVNKLATVTLWFEVDGDYFSSNDIAVMNGFSAINDIVWEQGSGSLWNGRVTIANMSGGITSDTYTDLFKLILSPKEELGNSTVKITRIDLSGYDDENKAVFIDSIFRSDSVETSVVEYFSPYDVNRDGNIDQLDLTTAQLYYAARVDEANWDEAKIADVNNDGRVDIEDLILILNNIVW